MLDAIYEELNKISALESVSSLNHTLKQTHEMFKGLSHLFDYIWRTAVHWIDSQSIPFSTYYIHEPYEYSTKQQLTIRKLLRQKQT